MTAKDLESTVDPWHIWPDGIIPGEGGRPEWKLRTSDEGRNWLKGLAEHRKSCRIDDGTPSIDIIRQERDER